jgi:hypothetical protein
LNDVETSIKENCVSRGVKGESILGLFTELPEQILLDKMHTTARGAQEDLLHFGLTLILVISHGILVHQFLELKSTSVYQE